MTVFGWDASDYDWGRGPMDLDAAHRDGIQLFSHKATEGDSLRHVQYGAALTRARDAGIPVLGAYHVVRTGPVGTQVAAFLAYLDEATPWWRGHPNFFLQVDLEKWPYDPVSSSVGAQFAERLRTVTMRTVIVYASRGQYDDSLVQDGLPLWNADYPTNATGGYAALYAMAGGDSGPGWQPYSGRTPAIWQYTSNATIGRQPGCDANAFRGTLDDLRALTSNKEDDMTPEEHIKLDAVYNLYDTVTLDPNEPPFQVPITKFLKDLAAKVDALSKPAPVDVAALAASLKAAGVGQVDVNTLAAALSQHLPSHITLTGTITP